MIFCEILFRFAKLQRKKFDSIRSDDLAGQGKSNLCEINHWWNQVFTQDKVSRKCVLHLRLTKTIHQEVLADKLSSTLPKKYHYEPFTDKMDFLVQLKKKM